MEQIPVPQRVTSEEAKVKKDSHIRSALKATPHPEKAFAEISKDKRLNMDETAQLCEWNIWHQDSNKYSLSELEAREDGLLSGALEKITPQNIIENLTVRLPKAVGTLKTLEIISSLPLEKLDLSEDIRRKLSAFAIQNLQTLDKKFLADSPPDIPVCIARGLSKRNLLDWSNLLEAKDLEKVQRKFEEHYEAILLGSMSGEARRVKPPEGAYEITHTPLSVSDGTQQRLRQYFGTSDFGVRVNQLKSSADSTYVNEMSTIAVGKENAEKLFRHAGFPMNQFAWLYMPTSDIRLNFNFTGDSIDIGKQAKTVSKLMAFAQLHGIPITSKLAVADNQSRFRARVLIYTDYRQLEILLMYLKENNLTPLASSIDAYSDNNVSWNISGTETITARGTGETANDINLLRRSFQSIAEKVGTA